MNCYKSIRDLYERYNSFLLDMYGVLYNGKELYDGVLDLLSDIKSAGKRVVILSNTTIVSEIAKKKYEKLGLRQGIHYDEFITSGEVFNKTVCKTLDGKNLKYFQIFNKNTEIFKNSQLKESKTIQDADFVYVGTVVIKGNFVTLDNVTDSNGISVNLADIFEREWSDLPNLRDIQDILNECKKHRQKLFVVNPDIFAVENVEGRRAPIICQGGVGEYYEHRMGGEVEYYGKPYKPMFNYAKQFTTGKIVMVGDTPWTDILGGNLFGIDTILTLTGISESFMNGVFPNTSASDRAQSLLGEISDRMTHSKLKNFNSSPTYIVESFAD